MTCEVAKSEMWGHIPKELPRCGVSRMRGVPKMMLWSFGPGSKLLNYAADSRWANWRVWLSPH